MDFNYPAWDCSCELLLQSYLKYWTCFSVTVSLQIVNSNSGRKHLLSGKSDCCNYKLGSCWKCLRRNLQQQPTASSLPLSHGCPSQHFLTPWRFPTRPARLTHFQIWTYLRHLHLNIHICLPHSHLHFPLIAYNHKSHTIHIHTRLPFFYIHTCPYLPIPRVNPYTHFSCGCLTLYLLSISPVLYLLPWQQRQHLFRHHFICPSTLTLSLPVSVPPSDSLVLLLHCSALRQGLLQK